MLQHHTTPHHEVQALCGWSPHRLRRSWSSPRATCLKCARDTVRTTGRCGRHTARPAQCPGINDPRESESSVPCPLPHTPGHTPGFNRRSSKAHLRHVEARDRLEVFCFSRHLPKKNASLEIKKNNGKKHIQKLKKPFESGQDRQRERERECFIQEGNRAPE